MIGGGEIEEAGNWREKGRRRIGRGRGEGEKVPDALV